MVNPLNVIGNLVTSPGKTLRRISKRLGGPEADAAAKKKAKKAAAAAAAKKAAVVSVTTTKPATKPATAAAKTTATAPSAAKAAAAKKAAATKAAAAKAAAAKKAAATKAAAAKAAAAKKAAAAAREAEALEALGLKSAITGVDLRKHDNVLLVSRLNIAEIDRFAPLVPLVPGLCNAIADLDLHWDETGHLYRAPTGLPDRARNPVVVIGQRHGEPAIKGWDNDRLIELARAENPGAPIIFCSPDDPFDRHQIWAERPDWIDHAGYSLGDALSVAARAYTVAAPGGIDALCRGVPLTVLADPFYAGWGFTDDRAKIGNRGRKLDFAQFFAILIFSVTDLQPAGDTPKDHAAAFLTHAFDVFARKQAVLSEATAFAGLMPAPLKAQAPSAEYKRQVAAHGKAKLRLGKTLSRLTRTADWPQLLERRVFSNLTTAQRATALQQLIDQDFLATFRAPELRWIVAAVLLGQFGRGDMAGPLLSYVGARLPAAEFGRMVSMYSRLAGVPLTTLSGALPEDAVPATGSAALDDIVHTAAAVVRDSATKGADALMQWADQSIAERKLGAARHMLECYFLIGRRAGSALDQMAEIFWQTFRFDVAAELLDWSSRIYPDWSAGRLHWRAAYASAVAGQSGAVLSRITAATLRNETNLQRLETLEEALALRYGNLPVADALEVYLMGSGESRNPLKLARYLIRQNRPAEAEAILGTLDKKAQAAVSYVIEMTYALALQGRHAEARALITARLKKGPDAELVNQAMRISYFSGDTAWAAKMLALARKSGFPVATTLERQVLFGAGDLRGALQSERQHVVGDMIKPHLRDKHVTSLAALVEGEGKEILVALINGPADDIRWAALFPRLAEACRHHSLKITCDPRLLGLLQRSFPQIAFVPSLRVRNTLPDMNASEGLPAAEVQKVFDGTGWQAASRADRVALITDLAADLVDSAEGCDGRPYLLPDPGRVAQWTERLQGITRPLVGIAWGSMRTTVLRNYDYLGVSEVIGIIAGSDATFVNLQYFDCSEDLRQIETACPGRMLHFADLDQMDDIEGVVALMACLDVVISPNSTPLVLSAAAGRPTWYADPAIANKYWGRLTRKETDYWFGTVVYVNGAAPGDKAGIVRRICTGLADLSERDAAGAGAAGTGAAGLARIEALLDTEPPTLEAQFFAYRKAILNAEADILAPRLYRDTRYWALRARLFEKLEIRQDAMECWVQACSQSRSPDPAHLIAHWQAQVRLGRLELAEKFGPVDMSALGPEGAALRAEMQSDRISNDLGNEALALLATGRRSQAAKGLRQALAASWRRPEFGDRLRAVVDRLAALQLSSPPAKARRDVGMSVWALPDLSSYIRHAAGQSVDQSAGQSAGQSAVQPPADAETLPPPAPVAAPPAPRSVFCAGYMFSGSGAVVDFLRQGPGVTVPGQDDGDQKPFDTELNIFRRFYGIQYLLDAPAADLSIEHLGEFLLGSVLGVIAHPSDGHRLDLSRKRSLRGAFDTAGRMEDLLGLCDMLLDAVEAGEGPDGEVILSAAIRMCNALVARFADDDRRVVVWNNCIQAYNARTLAIFDQALMVAVARDPRDQYAAQCYEWGERNGQNSVKNFIKRTHHQQALRAQFDQVPGLRARILDVRFEDVLTERAVRERLLDFAGIPREGFRHGLHFRPEESLRNVGIHRDFPDQAAMRAIAAEFPDMLWKG